MERWLGESSLQPLMNLVHHHETTYHAIQQFIDKPPGKVRVIEIYPPRPLSSMALGSRLPALREDYKTGRQCGRYFLATLGKLLAESLPLRRHTRLIPRLRWWYRLQLWPTMPLPRRWWIFPRRTIRCLITRI